MKLVLCLLACWTSLLHQAHANNEKVVFLAPAAIDIPNAGPSLGDLNLYRLSPVHSTVKTSIPVAFPNESYPRGVDYWHLLEDLNPGQRYEVRICWAAIQPTEFWLNVYNLSHVFDTPHLIQNLAAFVDSQSASIKVGPSEAEIDAQGGSIRSVLFLHFSAAADYFSSNETLMQDPPHVNIEIILDPFLANVFPRSLVPTAGYIIILAVGAWYVSGFVLRLLQPRQISKVHDD